MKPHRHFLATACVTIASLAVCSIPARSSVTTTPALGSVVSSGGARPLAPLFLAAAPDSAVPDAELAPSTAPVWVPSAPVPTEQPWETVLRLPKRAVGFPFKLLGKGLEGSLRYVEEASVVPRAQIFLAVLPRSGVFIQPASLGDRTGLGGMLRVQPRWLGGFVGADVSGSTRRYNRTRINAGYGPARVEFGYDWRPRERYFGNGLESDDELPSSYATRMQQVRLSLSYPIARRGQNPSRAQVGAWAGPRDMVLRRGRENPSFQLAYPGASGLLDVRQEHFVFGVRASLDQRVGTPHWTHGFKLAGAIERFDEAIETFALRDGHTLAPRFTRISFQAEGGLSFMRDPRTIRLSIQLVDQVIGKGHGPLLLPDLQSLGGSAGLFGFEPGRFHDNDRIVGRLMYIFPLSRNLEFEAHTETGGVYHQLNEARPSGMRTSYGFSFRPRLDTAPLGMIGLDWCNEGARIRFSFGGVE